MKWSPNPLVLEISDAKNSMRNEPILFFSLSNKFLNFIAESDQQDLQLQCLPDMTDFSVGIDGSSKSFELHFFLFI